jgi:hypothetical protein
MDFLRRYDSESSLENMVENEPEVSSLSTTETIPDVTEPAKVAFRTKLAEWKHSHLDAIIEDSQDTRKLNDYLKLTKELYASLMKHPEKEPLSADIAEPEFQMILERDLIESPFTYDIKLINSFSRRDNVFDGKIVPNK